MRIVPFTEPEAGELEVVADTAVTAQPFLRVKFVGVRIDWCVPGDSPI